MSDRVANTRQGAVACHDCGLVHHAVSLPSGVTACCTNCDATLFRQHNDSIKRALALTVAALFLFTIAHSLPFMAFELEGRERQGTLLTIAWRLYTDDMWTLAILVLLTATLLPLLRILALVYVLLPLDFGRVPRHMAAVFRAAQGLRRWAMMEILLIGVIVAYVKLEDLARVDLGPGLYTFAALILVMAAIDWVLDPHDVWERLSPQARASFDRHTAKRLVACTSCDQLCKLSMPESIGASQCPRCHAVLHRRRPDSVARSWALVLAAAILYVPANVLPIMTVVSFGEGEPDTILSGIEGLIASGMWPIALIVFIASVMVPILKLAGLAFLLISVQRRSRWRRRDRTVLYRLIEFVGRWSMIDIFMMSILVALVKLGAIATVKPENGAIAFAAVVIITMLASMAFDPRLIWDAEENDRVRA